MSEHRAKISWTSTDAPFTYDSYSRDHHWAFGTGESLEASSAAEYKGNPTLVNPEEALVAAASSCHMLTFLAVAAKKKIVVLAYEDAAVGHLEKNADGVLAVTRISLYPKIRFAEPVADDVLDALHHQAHKGCFIANSIKATVTVEKA